MSQRLVRKLCNHCKQLGPTDADGWQVMTGGALPVPDEVYHPVGCRHCRDTGYFGREGIYEVLVSAPEVQEGIVEGYSTRDIRDAAVATGMTPLRLAGAEKVISGDTTIEEVLRVTPALES